MLTALFILSIGGCVNIGSRFEYPAFSGKLLARPGTPIAMKPVTHNWCANLFPFGSGCDSADQESHPMPKASSVGGLTGR